ncbi:CBS domain-containing protein, partial [Bacillus sp. FJAT-50051]
MIPKHDCITAQENETLKAALDRLEAQQIDGLPVLQGNKYVGVVTR